MKGLRANRQLCPMRWPLGVVATCGSHEGRELVGLVAPLKPHHNWCPLERVAEAVGWLHDGPLHSPDPVLGRKSSPLVAQGAWEPPLIAHVFTPS